MMRPLDWDGPPLHVIGLGIKGGGALSTEAKMALERAEVAIGGSRHLATFPRLTATCLLYPTPFSDLLQTLRRHMGKRIVLLASGDPLLFGVGGYLVSQLGPDRLVFHPNISSIQYAFAKVKKAWDQATVVSLHGRPLNTLKSVLQGNRLYALLTDQSSTPVVIAELLGATGYAESRLWVAEDLGTERERIRAFSACTLANHEPTFSPLNVVILETRGGGGILPEFPGIPDERFVTDSDEPGKGMISKREIRLNILSLLAPRARECGWDVGAGCGGVSVEWARWNPQGRVYAIEFHEQRLRCLEANRERFGVTANLHIVPGYAPEVFPRLPPPDAVFVGGSQGKLNTILTATWQRLLPGGHLVVSAVTQDSRAELHHFAADKAACWSEISVARAQNLAGQRVLKPHLPVLLARLEKPGP